MKNYIVINPLSKKIQKTIKVPGSKSITNRALLLAALAKGKSILKNPLQSDDTKVMIKALKSLKVKITSKKNSLMIEGTGGKFQQASKPLYLGNAGTATRFLLAALSTLPFAEVITGDARMEERPIADLIKALEKLGSQIISLKKKNCIPLKIQGPLKGGKTTLKANISSQFLSALLMAAPYAEKKVTIQLQGKLTSKPYIDLTLDMMKSFEIKVKEKKNFSYEITPAIYNGKNYEIEGDASSATYAFALAALHGSRITIQNIPFTSKQGDLKFLDVLKKMSCKVLKNKKGITVQGTKKLKALGTIGLNDLPDAAMTIAILCAFTEGKSKLTGIGNLRVKETDRLKALQKELQKIGVQVKAGKNFLEIEGNPKKLHGATIETYNDHRMAMCFAIAGSKIPNIVIQNPNCVSKTYPLFWKDFKKLGLNNKQINLQKSNIVLGGLRGTGKSTIGKTLAAILHYKFLDTDEIIEKKERKKISDIIKEKGWSYFRALEQQLCFELQSQKHTVISTGGGMLLNPKNVKLLKKNGHIILLHCDPKISVSRIKQSYLRPALTSKKTPLEELIQLQKERHQKYLEAGDIFFDTSKESGNFKKDTLKKTKKILELLKENFRILQ